MAFELAFEVIVGSEGGFTSNPIDPGNWTGARCGVGLCNGTKFGISAAAYPGEPIATLTLEQSKAIYKRDYWDKIAGDALPPLLSLLVMDAAVNNGVPQAIRWLQMVCAATVDGQLGPLTLKALGETVATHGGAAVCAEYLALRLWTMSRYQTWGVFGLGWTRRIMRLPYQALRMVP
jgi:lysozyme family protein